MSGREIITMDDCRKAAHCASGVRRWFNAHDLDFRDFMQNGIEAERMLAVGDAHGKQVVERTRARRNG